MDMTRCEKLLDGCKAAHISRSENKNIYRIEGEGGSLLMTCYSVFPGIEIIYNDVHAAQCDMSRSGDAEVLEINHCLEGRIEYHYGKSFCYLEPGDMAVGKRECTDGHFFFPTGHYHGITVKIDLRRAPDCLSCFLQDVDVRPTALAERFCPGNEYFAARSSTAVEHVFSELYSVPEQIRKGYFKVKILELLLYLSALNPEMQIQQRSRFSQTQVQLAKDICKYLTDNMDSHVTLKELAQRFGVSESQVKSCFGGVYGMSPYAYMRSLKMRCAAQLLRLTDRTVMDIAGQYGYDNPSKFARAFRAVVGVSPNEYRCGVGSDSCAPEAEN